MAVEDPASIIAKFALTLGSETETTFKLDVDLSLPGDSVTAIYGHSGSGKTTLLRCIAGLETRQRGILSVNGEAWQDSKTFRPVHKRPLGYVFQEASLFPHLNTRQNLAFASRRATSKLNNKQYLEIIAMLGIEDLLSKYPEQLSGGEKQRVAIARALLVNPQILLMDEPLSSLDEQRKQEVLPYLEQLRDHINLPIIYVTHAMNEVTRLAQQAVLLKNGKVLSYGSLNQVFSHPVSGINNNLATVIDAKVLGKDERWQLTHCGFNGGELWLNDSSPSPSPNVRICIAASDVSISLDDTSNSSILNRLESRITALTTDPGSAMTIVQMQTGQQQLQAQVTNKSVHKLALKPGMTVWAQIKSAAIVR